MNNIFWKYIKSKGEVTLDRFWNFGYLSSYLRLKSFAWKWDYVIYYELQTNVTEFIKVILERSCKILLGPYILAVPKLPVFF